MHNFSSCTLCPRHCHVNRLAGQTGYCGQSAQLRVARAALHMWEEPCISGATGSGTVFFSGCGLGCVYCQNHDIAQGQSGKEISIRRLSEIFLELQQKGAANINLVTPTHYIPAIVCALRQASLDGLSLPVVYNSSGYEDVNALRLLEGLVHIYLPDLKYVSSVLSARYSHAADYFDRARLALAEMFRQVGRPEFSRPVSMPPHSEGAVYPPDTPLLRRGMLVRHLVLPGQVKDTKKVLHYLHDTYGNDIYVSVMCQYTPLPHIAEYAELNRRVSPEEYRRVIEYCLRLGMENVYIQDSDTAQESYIPPFDCSGV